LGQTRLQHVCPFFVLRDNISEIPKSGKIIQPPAIRIISHLPFDAIFTPSLKTAKQSNIPFLLQAPAPA
jgi:hypothetical protein